MALKKLIRSLLPREARAGLSRFLVERRERYVGKLPLDEAFDEVYRHGMWKQGGALSGVGSEGLLAERYVTLVRDYAARHQLRTVVDGGAGDFAVGSRLAPLFERYTALDVSQRIIAINRQRYAGADWRHVEFSVADMTQTTFPAADLILIRQVLQHLTNTQIARVLKNLDASSWRRVLITEDVHDPHANPCPNLDLPSHSIRTRRSLGSGVFLQEPPFNCDGRVIGTIYPTLDDRPEDGGLQVFEMRRGD